MFKKLFEDLGLSENTHRVYIALAENGASSARMLAENLSIPRPSVYDHLKILIKKGLVLERKENNRKFFQIDDPKNLPRLLEDKIASLQNERKELESMIPKMLNRNEAVEPKIRFFSGVDGVKQVLKDMLWYKDIETCAFWPINEMIDILGDEYFADMNRKRIRQKLSTKAIWPKYKKIDFEKYSFLGVGKNFYREIRVAPQNIKWEMGYWVYSDKVAFISSRKETFGFVIHSRDFAQMMKAQFETIWNNSKTLKVNPEHTESFLKTV